MYQRFFKRFLDVVLSGGALLALSPVLLITAILVHMKLGSPVIFCQERPGKDEKIFKMYKFRSMTSETDENGKLLPDEVRLTKFGKILRSTSLDELPELWNIFKGDMSIVGPRPLLASYLPFYTEEERHRHDVRPGLTGLAQVKGRNTINWELKFKFDIVYIQSISLKTDILVIMDTIQTVFKHEGVTLNSLEDFDEYRKDQLPNSNRKIGAYSK